MLLDQFYEPSDKISFLTVILAVILSSIIIIINPFIYHEVIIVNIITFILLNLFFKNFTPYTIIWIIVLCYSLSSWETIDISINKKSYYNIFQPMMKYNCLAGFSLNEKTIDHNVQCSSLNISKEDSIKLEIFFQKDETIKHLKKIGCYRIEISENWVQFWYSKNVIDVSKDSNNLIVHYISQLH